MFAGMPADPAVAGGLQAGFAGVSPEGQPVADPNVELLLAQDEASEPTALGPLLDMEDAEAFQAVDEMVRRQEALAKSRLACDIHYAGIKGGYPFSSLVKVQDRDVYQQAFPPGTLAPSAAPNKAADLCRKVVASLTVDPPKPDPEPEDDSETALAGAELAREFLSQDGSEAGTNDSSLFEYLLDGATAKATTFAHLWVDRTGGGSVAKQIKAHPQATDASRPLDAVDPATGQPMPSTDYVLRYVTADGQFTLNPSEAERVWLPKLRVDRMDRRHVRCYPESASIGDAEKVVLLWYATVSEARQRWPETVGQMPDPEIGALCDWEPPRASTLLPPALRARLRDRGNTASTDRKGSAGDERWLYFYCLYVRACPDYPQGGYRALNGSNGGVTLDKGPLAATVTFPSGAEQDAEVTDLRIGDIPVADLTLVQDPIDGDPTGVAVISFVTGANDASATLVAGQVQQVDTALNPARFVTAMSPLTADDIEQSRGTGKPAIVTSKDDVPIYEEAPVLPPATLETVQWLHEQMDSAVSLSSAAQGADDSPEVSGVARRIAVNQSLVGLGPMQAAFHRFLARYWRLKLQLAMQHFSVPQLLRYTGEDGAAKQEWFSGNNFALVGGVNIAPGSGTLLPPTERINFILQLRDAMLVDEDQADRVAAPAYQGVLGTKENPHRQRIERQVSSWLEGPPKGWEAEAMAYQQAVQQHAMLVQGMAQQQAELGMMQAVQPPPAPTPPWSPFKTLPMDAELPIATIRKRRLADLMATTAFEEQPEAWRGVVEIAYTEAVEAIRATQAPAPMPGSGSGGAPGQQVTAGQPVPSVAG